MAGQFNPDQNPFEDIVGGQRGGMMGGQQTHMMPGGRQMAGAQHPIPGSTQQQTAEQFQNPMEEQMMPGKEGTGSKFLLGAIQNIQGYIQMSTDPRKIQMMRQLVTVFTNMLAAEQQEALQYLQGGEGEEGEEMMMGGMGGGMQ